MRSIDEQREPVEHTQRAGSTLAVSSASTQTERREFVRRVIALDPMVDQTLGESSHARYHSPTLRSAVDGLFMALGGWRGVETHLSRLSEDVARRQTEIILRSIPPELRSARKPGTRARWMGNPMAPRRVCDEAAQTLLALPASNQSLRLCVSCGPSRTSVSQNRSMISAARPTKNSRLSRQRRDWELCDHP